MTRWIVISFVAVLVLAMIDRASAERRVIPSLDRPFTYQIEMVNGTDRDAGTAHSVNYSGVVGVDPLAGVFSVSPEPNGLDRIQIGPYASPLTSLYFTLNGLAPAAPDNWVPVQIRVVEWVNGVENRVVVDHNPWAREFNDQDRTHEIFAE